MNLMFAVGGISDRHIEEFADVSPKKRRVPLWLKISSAACLTVVVAAAGVLVPVIKNKMENQVSNDGGVHGNLACVYFNDRIYSPYSNGGISKLPEGYVEVGEIISNDNIDFFERKINGTGLDLHIGDKLYQDPEHTEDMYVYTDVFNYGKANRYELYTDKTYCRVRINGRTYVRDYEKIHFHRPPNGYDYAGEVTTNDRNDRYVDGFGQDLEIGDKIYCSPYEHNIVYVYFSREDHCYGFVAIDD